MRRRRNGSPTCKTVVKLIDGPVGLGFFTKNDVIFPAETAKKVARQDRFLRLGICFVKSSVIQFSLKQELEECSKHADNRRVDWCAKS